jgi:hypothetical protein
MSIDFDVEKLIGRLDIIEKTQIPFAANLALRRLGSLLKNQLLPAEMQKSFTAPDGYGKPVPRTLSALLYSAEGMTLSLDIKGEPGRASSPQEYLRSAFLGGEPTMTSLTKAVETETKRFPYPSWGNLKALGQLTTAYDIKPSFAREVAKGIQDKKTKRGERYVVILEENQKRSRNGKGLKAPAIYRVKTGNRAVRIFTLGEKPDLKPTLDYEAFVRKTAEQRLPSLLDLALQRAMATR